MKREKNDSRTYLSVLFGTLCSHSVWGIPLERDYNFFLGALFMAEFLGFITQAEFNFLVRSAETVYCS